jgi:hypothetical protein
MIQMQERVDQDHLINLRSVERDARSDITRSDILPHLVEDPVSSYSTRSAILATTLDHQESRHTTRKPRPGRHRNRIHYKVVA